MRELTLSQVAALWDAMAGDLDIGVADDESFSVPKARECRAILDSIFDKLPCVYKSSLMHESKRNGEDKTTREQVREFFQACANALVSEEEKAARVKSETRLMELMGHKVTEEIVFSCPTEGTSLGNVDAPPIPEWTSKPRWTEDHR